MQNTFKKLKRNTRILIIVFMIALVVSGITAIPLQVETFCLGVYFHTHYPGSAVDAWLLKVFHALDDAAPFLAYGFDWLAFAHIIIAIVFIGPLMDPVRNKWVIQYGMIACVLIIPTAIIAGHFKDIPIWWRLIDCSFGIFGLIPLGLILRNIHRLEIIEQTTLSQFF